MERRRQKTAGRAGGPVPAGADEEKRAVAAEPIGQTCAAAEVEEVGAAAHRHVLAGVNESSGDRILERGSPAPAPSAGLEERHPHARFDERRGRSQPRKAAADDRDVKLRFAVGSAHDDRRLRNRGPRKSVVKAEAMTR